MRHKLFQHIKILCRRFKLVRKSNCYWNMAVVVKLKNYNQGDTENTEKHRVISRFPLHSQLPCQSASPGLKLRRLLQLILYL